MADPALQALLDPDDTRRGIRILRRVDSGDGVKANYYCIGQVTGRGKEMWVETTAADTDAQRNTAIRAAFGVA